MQAVYLETTFISYLVALPARDLIVAAHQQVTRNWWRSRRNQFRCVVSPVVIDEISLGDESEIKKRVEIVAALEVLSASAEAEELTQAIMNAGIPPVKAVRDAAHISVAATHGIEYLLTWNCRHLANAQISRRIQKVCASQGFEVPLICTPEELLEEITDE